MNFFAQEQATVYEDVTYSTDRENEVSKIFITQSYLSDTDTEGTEQIVRIREVSVV